MTLLSNWKPALHWENEIIYFLKSKKFAERKSTCGKAHGWAQRNSCTFGKFKSFIKGQFCGSLSSLRQEIEIINSNLSVL